MPYHSVFRPGLFDGRTVLVNGGGALPFDWVHPREGGVAEYRFMEAPRVSAATAVLFSVSLKLEQMP